MESPVLLRPGVIDGLDIGRVLGRVLQQLSFKG